MVPIIAGIVLGNPAGSKLGVEGLSHLRENFAVLSVWTGLLMAVAGMAIFRIMRERAGLGICTVLALAETLVAMAVTLS